jgi:hypothetical protein
MADDLAVAEDGIVIEESVKEPDPSAVADPDPPSGP